MVRSRTRDPSLQASPAADRETVRVAYAYLASATLWLLVGTATGLRFALCRRPAADVAESVETFEGFYVRRLRHDLALGAHERLQFAL